MDCKNGLMSVSMPCYIGCDLVGGDWAIVFEIPKKTFSGTAWDYGNRSNHIVVSLKAEADWEYQ